MQQVCKKWYKNLINFVLKSVNISKAVSAYTLLVDEKGEFWSRKYIIKNNQQTFISTNIDEVKNLIPYGALFVRSPHDGFYLTGGDGQWLSIA
jgi:hypothetical protein